MKLRTNTTTTTTTTAYITILCLYYFTTSNSAAAFNNNGSLLQLRQPKFNTRTSPSPSSVASHHVIKPFRPVIYSSSNKSTKANGKLYLSDKTSLLMSNEEDCDKDKNDITITTKTSVVSKLSSVMNDYISILRLYTVVQAVGALFVGYLSLLPTSSSFAPKSMSMIYQLLLQKPLTLFQHPITLATLSVCFSYGGGMVINDVADASFDASSSQFINNANDNDDDFYETKSKRPIASGRISKLNGLIYSVILFGISLSLAHCTVVNAAATITKSWMHPFVLWTSSNILMMIAYAYKLGRMLLVKNLTCGWLSISPLVGAAILATITGGDASTSTLLLSSARKKLFLLAAPGFTWQVSREILKDVEDVNIDRGQKRTVPVVIGAEAAKLLAHNVIALVVATMIFTPYYWNMFASKYHLYGVSVGIATTMIWVARRLSLRDGQQLVKKSIYVMFGGMIGSLLFSG